MKTYQDLTEAGLSEETRADFIEAAIRDYKTSPVYITAVAALEYARGLNPTITQYKKLLYTITGKAVPDNYSANHKCASNFFYRFINQENQYLLGNGVTFNEDGTKDILGGDEFDGKLQKAGFMSLWGGVSYGFFNNGKVDVFSALEFIPLYDEEDGAMKAGIRFWQIADNKPLRATLYELDGYTDYMRTKDKKMSPISVNGSVVGKRAYIVNIVSTPADGVILYNGQNYPTFPIVPLYANPLRQSELVGRRTKIDAYDLIESGFANDLDDASMIYWTIQNAGGMDDVDLAKFVERMKTVKAAVVDDEGARAEAHTMDVPYQAREAALSRLENDIIADFMAMDVKAVSAGNVTATQIEASYQDLDLKTDLFEYEVNAFIKGLLAVAGVDDKPIFPKRSKITNQTEQTQMVLSSAGVLDDETIIKHLPFLSVDEIDTVLQRKAEEEYNRVAPVTGEGQAAEV